MNKEQAVVIWNGMGGELDRSEAVDVADGQELTNALIDLIRGQVVSPGDTFEVRII